LQAPLCAVRAGQKINQVFYIGEDKRNRKEKQKQEGGSVCTHRCAPSAQDKRKIRYSTLQKKKEKKKRKKETTK